MTTPTAEQPESSPPASDEVVRGVARGGMWSIGAQAAGVAAGLILTPFTIRLLGPARYGLWSLLTSALSWLGLADLGMGQASTRLAGERTAQNDGIGEALAVWTAAAITVACTSAAAAVVIALAPEILGLLHIRGSLLPTGILALRIAAATCVVAVISGTLNTSLIVRQRWASYTLVASGTSILQVALLPAALALLSPSLVTATCVALACTLLQATMIVVLAVRVQPLLSRIRLSRKVARQLIAFGGALTIAGVASIALTSAERLLLGHFSSAVTVAYYAVASRLASQITLVPTALVGPIYPALVTLHGGGDAAGARRLYRLSLQSMFLALTPLVCALAFVAHPFLSLWAGSIYGQHSLVPFDVLLVGVWFNAIAWLPATYMTAAANPRLIAIIHVSEVVPYVAAAALLTANFGAVGAAIAWTGRVIVDALVFGVVARRVLGASLSPLTQRPIRAVVGPLMLGLAFFILSSPVHALLPRIASAVSILFVYATCSWRFVLTPDERRGLWTLAQNLAPRRRVS